MTYRLLYGKMFPFATEFGSEGKFHFVEFFFAFSKQETIFEVRIDCLLSQKKSLWWYPMRIKPSSARSYQVNKPIITILATTRKHKPTVLKWVFVGHQHHEQAGGMAILIITFHLPLCLSLILHAMLTKSFNEKFFFFN